jgi:hypothetical protein
MKILNGTMIDGETLALGPLALLWEVAIVPFQIEIGEETAHWSLTGQPMNILLDYDGMSTRGFDIDMGTIAWTSNTRKGDAEWDYWREKHFNPGASPTVTSELKSRVMTPTQALEAMKEAVGSNPVWFRNAAFDVPAIENLASKTGMKMPWHRRQQSDIYSQLNLAKQMNGYEDTLPAVTGHRAFDDSIGQIKQLTGFMQSLLCAAPSSERTVEDTPGF